MIALRPSLVRDAVTMVASAAYFLIGAVLGCMGPVSGEVRHELHLSATLTGLHGSMFGWSLLTCGLAARWLLRVVGPASLLRGGLVIVIVGVVVLAAGRHVAVTLAGAALIGVGAASMVLVMPAILSGHHAEVDRVRALTFANALSVMGNITALGAIAVTLRFGWGWRWTFAVIGVAVGGSTLLFGAVRHVQPSREVGSREPDHAVRLLASHAAVRGRWLVLVLGISIEFATLLWGSATLQELGHARPAIGAVGVGVFSAGMVLARLIGPRGLAGWPRRRAMSASFGLAVVAWLGLRFGPGLPGRMSGLLVLGVAVALIYPVGFSRLYLAGVPSSSVGAIGALASGTAVTFSPLALGALADLIGLGRALFMIPVLAVMGLVMVHRQADDQLLGS